MNREIREIRETSVGGAVHGFVFSRLWRVSRSPSFQATTPEPAPAFPVRGRPLPGIRAFTRPPPGNIGSSRPPLGRTFWVSRAPLAQKTCRPRRAAADSACTGRGVGLGRGGSCARGICAPHRSAFSKPLTYKDLGCGQSGYSQTTATHPDPRSTCPPLSARGGISGRGWERFRNNFALFSQKIRSGLRISCA